MYHINDKILYNYTLFLSDISQTFSDISEASVDTSIKEKGKKKKNIKQKVNQKETIQNRGKKSAMENKQNVQKKDKDKGKFYLRFYLLLLSFNFI